MSDVTLPDVAGPGTPPAPKPPANLENVLALQANDAISKGADPKAVSDMLGQMVTHLRANPTLAQQGADAISKGADPGKVAGVVAQQISSAKPSAAPPERPGILSRSADMIGGALKQIVTHPLDTAGSLVGAPVKSLMDAVLSPGVGETPHDPRLSKGGNSGGMTLQQMQTPYDAQHGGVTPTQRTQAGLQTLANVAAPAIAKGVGGLAAKVAPKAISSALGLSAAAAPAGAAYTPDDPAAGALSAGILAPVLGAAGKGVGKAAGAAGSTAADLLNLRRPETGPLVQTRFGNVGPTLLSESDKAAQQLGSHLTNQGVDLNAASAGASATKPLTLMEVAGDPALRRARGLKTAYPEAGQALRDALQPRAEGAVERVINHGLEATGLQSRESGILSEDALRQKATQEGNAAYGQTFANSPNRISDEMALSKINEILETPAGQQALRRGATIAANRRDPIGNVTSSSGGTPPGFSPEQWADNLRLMQERGMPIPNVPGDQTVKHFTPTLKQAHYIKLGFDDQLNGAPEPGSGGSGPNNAAAVRGLKNEWLGVMDEQSPDYAAARKQYADTKQLEDAANMGQQWFKLHPDQLKLQLNEMPEAAQLQARRAGFNALAERVENGPTDVSKSLSKGLDQKRMRLLFPDDESFNQFKEGLKQEAQMHQTNQTIFGGSQTADKLADMASMAGIDLPTIAHLAKGGLLRAGVHLAGKAMTKAAMIGNGRSAVEQAGLLSAGASGNSGELQAAIAKMQGRTAPQPRPGLLSGLNTAAPAIGAATSQRP